MDISKHTFIFNLTRLSPELKRAESFGNRGYDVKYVTAFYSTISKRWVYQYFGIYTPPTFEDSEGEYIFRLDHEDWLQFTLINTLDPLAVINYFKSN